MSIPKEDWASAFNRYREVLCGESCAAPDAGSVLDRINRIASLPVKTQQLVEQERRALLGELSKVFGWIEHKVPALADLDPCQDERPGWMSEAQADVWCSWFLITEQHPPRSMLIEPSSLTEEGSPV